MRFGILGPLHVGDGVSDRAVTAGRDRVVLAMLLLRPNQVVPVDHLIDAMWPESPPATARGQLQSCIFRLRRALPAAGLSADVISSDPAGYAITVGAGDLDATVFDELVEQARQNAAGHRPDQASKLLRAALDLWRGPALAGILSPAVRNRATALDERHALAVEDWADLELQLGRQRQALGELIGLVRRYPLRERLRGQLIEALHRSGRQADALAEYRRVRLLLRDELGIEPGTALRELHQRILTGHEGPGAGPPPPAAPVRCLPRLVADFTGRGEVAERLLGAAANADPLAPVIQVIDGMAGSGKTTLAVVVANRLASRYPDAQLYVDLHGHSERRPVEPTAALATLLRQLGVAGDRIPTGLDDRMALWRSELSTRRCLVLLDNAASTAQVTPLLPAAGGSAALLTSRRRLSGLDGARPESLGLLPAAEAVELLARIAGERVNAEPAAALEVVRRCGYLPLAIRLAGARLAHRPRWRVAELVRRLVQPGAVLAELVAEDRTVASAFALSYDQLDDPAQRLFRLLGLFPGDQFDAPAAAALAGVPLAEAADLLDVLVDQHLIEEPETRRFRFHDLIREYAHQLANQLSEDERRRAVVHLLDYYLHVAAGVSRGLESAGRFRDIFQTGVPLRPELLPRPLPEPRTWFERERTNLDAVSRCAEEWAEDRYTWMIARAGWRLWFSRGHFEELVAAHRRGLAAAHRLADDVAVGMMGNYLASGYNRLDLSKEAIAALEIALAAWERNGSAVGRATTRGHLCAVYTDLGRYDLAALHGQEGLAILRRLPDLIGIGRLLPILGDLEMSRDNPRVALGLYRRGLMLARELGVHAEIALSLSNVARARTRLGDHGPAARLLRAALALRQQADDQHGAAVTLNDLAALHRALGQHDEAVRLHRGALATAERLGALRLAGLVRRDLARTLAATGEAGAARDGVG